MRDFGCYNHGELKYLRNILLRYWFHWVLVFFFFGEIVFIPRELSL